MPTPIEIALLKSRLERTTGGGYDEKSFRDWYAEKSAKLGLNPNPDDPQHYYDYRAAFISGADAGDDDHWPSKFKLAGHPNRFVDGMDTKTGRPESETDTASMYGLPPRPADSLNTRLLDDGTISQGTWTDGKPGISAAFEMVKEMTGVAPSARLMDRIGQIRSPVLRPQSAFEWGDWAAGTAAEGLQTALAGADLAGLAGKVGPMAGKRLLDTLADQRGQVDVWHGSPHRFDKMSLDKIGTGEGAQAFGYGLYFTDKKDIAAHYANQEKLSKYGVRGETIPHRTSGHTALDTYNDMEMLLGYRKYGHDEMAKIMENNIDRRIQRWMKTEGQNPTGSANRDMMELTDYYLKNVKNATPDDIGEPLPKGNTYRAQIFPGKDPSEYTFLDWYEPVSASNKSDELKKIVSEVFGDDHKIQDFYNKNSAFMLYNHLAKKLGSEKEASSFLKQRGIDGIRYPTDTLSSKGYRNNGEYNYVVFDDKDIKLVSRESGGQVEDLLEKLKDITE